MKNLKTLKMGMKNKATAKPAVVVKKKVVSKPVAKPMGMKNKPAKPAAKTGKVILKKKIVSKPVAAVVKKKVAAKPAVVVKKKVKRGPAPAVMNKTQLIAYYMETLDWVRGDVVDFLAAQDALIAKGLSPKGSGEFLFPGMFKIISKGIPAKKMPAVKKGALVKGFGGVEVVSPGRAAFTKPAAVRIRMRAMAKLKAAALGN